MSRNPKNKLREPIPIPEPAPLPEPEEINIQDVYNEYIAGTIDLLVVLGPTASGKTRYAVDLARRLSDLGTAAEILSADSRQVYKGMDIGTGKDLNEYGDVPYHLIDIAPAGMRFDLYQWQEAFEEAYKDVRSRGRIPRDSMSRQRLAVMPCLRCLRTRLCERNWNCLTKRCLLEGLLPTGRFLMRACCRAREG